MATYGFERSIDDKMTEEEVICIDFTTDVQIESPSRSKVPVPYRDFDGTKVTPNYIKSGKGRQENTLRP